MHPQRNKCFTPSKRKAHYACRMDGSNFPEYAAPEGSLHAQSARYRLTLATNARIRSEYMYLLAMRSVCQDIREGLEGLQSAGIHMPSFDKTFSLIDRIASDDRLHHYETWLQQSQQGQTTIFMPERLQRMNQMHRAENLKLRELIEKEVIPDLCTIKPIPAAAQGFNQRITPFSGTLKQLAHYLEHAQKFYAETPARMER